MDDPSARQLWTGRWPDRPTTPSCGGHTSDCATAAPVRSGSGSLSFTEVTTDRMRHLCLRVVPFTSSLSLHSQCGRWRRSPRYCPLHSGGTGEMIARSYIRPIQRISSSGYGVSLLSLVLELAKEVRHHCGERRMAGEDCRGRLRDSPGSLALGVRAHLRLAVVRPVPVQGIAGP